MKTFDFIQATISYNLKSPHSKALEPDCLSPFACDCNTASEGEGWTGTLKLILTYVKSDSLRANEVSLPGDKAPPAWFSNDFPVTHDHFAPDHG
jgi:hypothetical protein